MNTKMVVRKVLRVIKPQSVVEGAGVRLKRSIATAELDYLDPFLLFDHFGSNDPADYLAGFPMHPHRGIETVTYMLAGAVQHRDSLNNSGVIGAGDVQWMTAGGGIMHEEMPEPRDGKMEGFQLWVNLPARLKMSRPRYQEIKGEQIPSKRLAGGGWIRVIAGEVEGTTGPVTEIVADPTYLDISLPNGQNYSHPVSRGHTALAYLFEGAASFSESSQFSGPMVFIFSDGDQIQIQAGPQGARFLLISGLPLGEPIARYGPFVMNTRAEILQALEDLRNGTFVYSEQ
jgi:redox-sensitive bicupin YhaK (pirin superfamily)